MMQKIIPLTIVMLAAVHWPQMSSGKNGVYAHFELRRSCAGWQAGFADYWAAQESDYELAWKCAHEATDLNRGLVISGSNHSDDLFMFIKHSICGLKPQTVYRVEACIELMSKAPTGCIGIGGDPGASVYVKFGATTGEPTPVVKDDGRVRMNVDIGSQSEGGADAVVIGNITTSITDCHNERYEVKELKTPGPIAVRSDATGTLWIFIGTDSGFEGKTSVIYTDVRVQVHKQHPDHKPKGWRGDHRWPERQEDRDQQWSEM